MDITVYHPAHTHGTGKNYSHYWSDNAQISAIQKLTTFDLVMSSAMINNSVLRKKFFITETIGGIIFN
jgi:hypothetical protein